LLTRDHLLYGTLYHEMLVGMQIHHYGDCDPSKGTPQALLRPILWMPERELMIISFLINQHPSNNVTTENRIEMESQQQFVSLASNQYLGQYGLGAI
jgi:hypothetical protein